MIWAIREECSRVPDNFCMKTFCFSCSIRLLKCRITMKKCFRGDAQKWDKNVFISYWFRSIPILSSSAEDEISRSECNGRYLFQYTFLMNIFNLDVFEHVDKCI